MHIPSHLLEKAQVQNDTGPRVMVGRSGKNLDGLCGNFEERPGANPDIFFFETARSLDESIFFKILHALVLPQILDFFWQKIG